MSSDSLQKRASPFADDISQPSKRRRTTSSVTAEPVQFIEAFEDTITPDHPGKKDGAPNFNTQSRMGLRRGIMLALDHVGFDSASEEALESYTQMTEIYLTSIVEDIMSMANGARRTQAIPTDFELALKSFNLSTSALRPHRKPPVPRPKLQPTFTTQQFLDEGETIDLPCLDDELSGAADKESKQYIPASFPRFPSIHTYKYTPVDVESVTTYTNAAHDKDGTAKRGVPGCRGDPKKMLEMAAKEAGQAEDALRRLVRASKTASLKDLRSVAEKNPASKERYELWEAAMKECLTENSNLSGNNIGGSDAVRKEVAEHCMIVNAQKKYHRKEIARTAKRMRDGVKGKM